MSDGILSLFPPQGVDQTIHVAILLGVLALLFLNESFGWVYSGLVVPGYLASLLVLAPMSTGAVMFEAVLTFALSRALSELASKSGAWSKFFGRERFLLLVFVSVVVRQSSELWVLPEILRWVDGELDTNYRLTRDLSSIGLVLVPLTANMFWKLDLRSGLVQIAVPTLLVFVVLQYVLLPYTNLSFSRLELTYENVALDFLSSPKAYIVLLIGALLGARYNLRYGWDYSGILMPALLAVACFSPMRLVTTAVEAVALVLIINTILMIPGLRNLSLQGPRKIAFVFTISFFMKFALGWYVGVPDSEAKVSDLFGFGYLVPSLIAVKMLDREAISQILFPAFSVAIISLVLGSGIGLALDQVAPPPPIVGDGLALPESSPTTVLAQTPVGVMSVARARARLDIASDTPLARSRGELDRQAELWRAVERWLRTSSEADRATVATFATERGLVLIPMPAPIAGRPAFALIEREERLGAQLGWNTSILVPGAKGPILDVPRPATEPPTAEVAALRCAPVACRAVIASGLDTREAGLDVGDALANSQTPHAIALRELRASSVVRFRADARVPRGKPILDVGDHLPELDLATLWPTQLELSWQGSPSDQVAVLRAHPDDLWLALAAAGHAPATGSPR
ncbi:MAG: poly-gamma-glutamate biosynthesis protein PgsC/CapC [Kofleriaceae bacterium]